MRLFSRGGQAAIIAYLRTIFCFALASACLLVSLGFIAEGEPDKGQFEPVCRGPVNITINPNQCYAAIKIPTLLLGDYELSEYTIEIFDQTGKSLGDTIPGVYAGQTVDAVVSHTLSSFSCTTPITIYDLNAPVLSIPEDATLACTEAPELSLTGKATATDCTPVSVTYTDEWTETLCGNPKIEILRIWTATDAQGFTTVDTQYIAIARAAAADLRFPADVDYSCTQYLADPTLIEPLAEKAGIPNLVDNTRCGLIYTYQDQRLPFCGDPLTSFIILRKWTVLDACGSEVFEVDGAGNDNTQFIRVLDQTAPQIEPVIEDIKATVREEDNGLGVCSSVGFIPAPQIVDECNDVTIRMFSAIGELEYANGVDGSEGGYIPFPGLTLGGPHQIYYEVVDACGNESNTSAFINVIDAEVPIMLCDQQVTVSLSLVGRGRLEPFMVDEGTRDNCCLDKMQIKWIDEPITSFRDRIDMFCVSESRRAVLRAWDCQGNYNDCETTVVTHDPLPATLVAIPKTIIEVDCSSDRQIYSNPQYEAPLFQDNCPLDIQFSIRDSINECGTADLWREWTVQDHPDNQVLYVSQLIRFVDDELPTISISPTEVICDLDGDCQESITIPFTVADNCSENLEITHRFSFDGGAFVEDTYGQISQGPDGLSINGIYPVGKHEFYLTVVDGCGNTANSRYAFEIKDCAPPTLLCKEDLEFFLGEDQQIVLMPQDFVEVLEEPCSRLTLSFANTEAENLMYDCDSLGLRQISIWATDSENNRSKCTANFTISQEGRNCEALGRLTGRILNENGEGVALVEMSLVGPDTLRTVTNAEGYYLFESVPLDTDYELSAAKQINPNNGVSVLDILRMSKHILGLDYMTSPYQILAADVNNSGNISTLDIIAARRVILGLSEYFADNTESWRFVPLGYVFINPENPLQERVPSSLNLKLVSEEAGVNFTAIKYGDVNGSADPGK